LIVVNPMGFQERVLCFGVSILLLCPEFIVNNPIDTAATSGGPARKRGSANGNVSEGIFGRKFKGALERTAE
jgi:hypothetical protein